MNLPKVFIYIIVNSIKGTIESNEFENSIILFSLSANPPGIHKHINAAD